MLNDLTHYALYHPHQVDLNQFPRCAITNAPLPDHLQQYKGNLGHQEVWELITPLFIQDQPTIHYDESWNIIVTGPMIRFYFYCWAYNEVTKGDLSRLIEQLRQEAIRKGGLFINTLHRTAN